MIIHWREVETTAVPWRLSDPRWPYTKDFGFFLHAPSALLVEAIAAGDSGLCTRVAAWFHHATTGDGDPPPTHLASVGRLLAVTGPLLLAAAACGVAPTGFERADDQRTSILVSGKGPTHGQWLRMLRTVAYRSVVSRPPDGTGLSSLRLSHLLDLTAFLLNELREADPALCTEDLVGWVLAGQLVEPSQAHLLTRLGGD